MNKDLGWISIHRQLKGHWIWQDPLKLKWWLDILLTVNTAPAKMNIGNDIIECKRGQSIKSLQTWAAEWGTSKDKVRNFFKLLEKDKMITLENIKISTRLTVCKYDSYQSKSNGKPTADKREPNADQTQTHPNNNVDNDNKENTLSISEMFEACRKIYPGTKRGLETELADLAKKYKPEFSADFFRAIYKGISLKIKTNKELERAGQFVPEWPHFKTYLYQKRWEEETKIQPKANTEIKPYSPQNQEEQDDLFGGVSEWGKRQRELQLRGIKNNYAA